MTDPIFKIHPTINFARVGNSEEYYIAPETAAGDLIGDNGLMGGLPIKPGTEATVIDANDLRDANQNLKRQAARFRLYAYDNMSSTYPSGGGSEVTIGSKVGDKTIKDIVWTVHVANKKANNFAITSANGSEEGIVAYQNGNTPPVRNQAKGQNPATQTRLRELVIDAGPRAIESSSNGAKTLPFSRAATSSYSDAQGAIHSIPDYPMSFPDDHFTMFNAQGTIDTLGAVTIEKDTGRLIVLGAYGRASGWETDGIPPKLDDAIDNDYWFDDVSDGPVNAIVVFDDGTSISAAGAWVITTDPAYAPQTRNVVSTWDDIYNTWVQELNLVPALYADGKYNADYQPSFDDDILPVFHAAMLQQWNTNLPRQAIQGHQFVGAITASDNPQQKIPHFRSLIRDPNDQEQSAEGVKMPLSLGDAMKSFLTVSETQYFFLNQWYTSNFTSEPETLGPGEKLDRVVLQNGLGGRYSPGIELTFIVRDVNLYVQDWQASPGGPFRINQELLDYSKVQKDQPVLGVGYVPLRSAPVQPGDLSKFMALPWHTDYNSCATHEPDPNPLGNNTLYWSWPAQRPVAVYPASECSYNRSTGTWNLGGQLYSVRGNEGKGTHTDYPQQQGRFQCYFDFVENWEKVGFVIQGLQISDDHNGNYGADKFLEVSSLFDTNGDMVPPWPIATLPGYEAPSDCGPTVKK